MEYMGTVTSGTGEVSPMANLQTVGSCEHPENMNETQMNLHFFPIDKRE
jgi:hypothetical protein